MVEVYYFLFNYNQDKHTLIHINANLLRSSQIKVIDDHGQYRNFKLIILNRVKKFLFCLKKGIVSSSRSKKCNLNFLNIILKQKKI